MDELHRAVAPFLPSLGDTMHGGNNLPQGGPGPSGHPSIFPNEHQPGPEQGQTRARPARNVYNEIRQDPFALPEMREVLVLEKRIMTRIQRLVEIQNLPISNRDIQVGVELFLYDIIEKNQTTRLSDLNKILKNLNSRGIKSVYYELILNEIEDLNG